MGGVETRRQKKPPWLSQRLGVWRLYVLRAETHSDEPRRDALQERPAVDELENPRRLDVGAAKDALDHVILDCNLHPLCRAGGKFAAPLHASEFVVIRRSRAQWSGKNIGGGDRILNRQTDAHAPNRRHRMGRIADAKQSWPPPTLEAIHYHREQLNLLPIGDLFHTVAQKGSQLGKMRAKDGQAAGAKLLIAALGNDEGALPVRAAVQHYQEFAGINAAQRNRRIALSARNTHPEDIHGRAEIDDFEAGFLTKDGMAAICGNGETGANFELALC